MTDDRNKLHTISKAQRTQDALKAVDTGKNNPTAKKRRLLTDRYAPDPRAQQQLRPRFGESQYHSLFSLPKQPPTPTFTDSANSANDSLLSTAIPRMELKLQAQIQRKLESPQAPGLTQYESRYALEHPAFVRGLTPQAKASLSTDNNFQQDMASLHAALTQQPEQTENQQDVVNQSASGFNAMCFMQQLYGITNTDNIVRDGMYTVVLVSNFQHAAVPVLGHTWGAANSSQVNLQMDNTWQTAQNRLQNNNFLKLVKRENREWTKEHQHELREAYEEYKLETNEEVREEKLEQRLEALHEAAEEKREEREEAAMDSAELAEESLVEKLNRQMRAPRPPGSGGG